MHVLREILRQKLVQGRSHREVVASVGVSIGKVSSVLARAHSLGLDAADVEAMSVPADRPAHAAALESTMATAPSFHATVSLLIRAPRKANFPWDNYGTEGIAGRCTAISTPEVRFCTEWKPWQRFWPHLARWDSVGAAVPG